MRVLYIMGVFYLAALFILWTGGCGRVSRKLAALIATACLLAGSGALTAAVLPRGNGYGKTVNCLADLTVGTEYSGKLSGTKTKKDGSGNGSVISSQTAHENLSL